MEGINSLADLKIGMKFMAKDKNCVEFAGAEAEDVKGNQLAMFELFCSGRMITCPVENALDLMKEQEFVKISEADWMKRVIAVAEYAEKKEIYKTYLDRYKEMEYSDKEIEKMYEAKLEG